MKGAGEAWKRSLESSSCSPASRGELLQLSLLGEGFVQCDLAPAGRYLFAELRMIAALVSGGEIPTVRCACGWKGEFPERFAAP